MIRFFPRGAGLSLLLAATLVLGCQRPLPEEEQETLAERVEGCWALSARGDGGDAETVARWLEEGTLPGAVRLDTVRYEPEGAGEADAEERYAAWSYVYSRKQRDPFSAWSPMPPDSIRVETPGAMAGLQLRLEVGDAGLTGTAVSFTDAVGPGEEGRRSGPVGARPTECPG